MFGQTKSSVRHNKMDPVVLNIVFSHCVIWWLLYFGKEAQESHVTTQKQREKATVKVRFGCFFNEATLTVKSVSLFSVTTVQIFTFILMA